MKSTMITRILKSESGGAFATALVVMMFVSFLGVAILGLSTSNLARSNRDQKRMTAFYLAEAGSEYMIDQATTTAINNGGNIPTINYDASTLFNSLVSGGTGTVRMTPDSGNGARATIISTATYQGVTQSTRVRINIKNVGIWNNAIFAGIGQSGRGINGNVTIAGSVHILGEGDPFTDLNGNGARDTGEAFTDGNGNGKYDAGESFTDSDGNGVYTPYEPYVDTNLDGMYTPPMTASSLDALLSGNADIINNYSGISAALSSKIPALPLQSIGGESIQSLNAELRVKHGRFGLSGAASAGQANATGNTIKETIDGAYVTDGWAGNAGAGNVHADNGSSNGYDLGDRVKFPSLQLPYTDSAGTSYASYAAYLNTRSVSMGGISNITTATPSFWVIGSGASIQWNQATSTLTVSGIVHLPGPLNLGTKDSTIYFSGKGTLYVDGDVNVHGSVMPKTFFPTTDSIGVISGHDINFATGSGESQLQAMGAWYAERQIKSAKQNMFAGTYVSQYFDMGTNVPSIYQVPTLASNLPPGMPGGESILVVQVTSWRLL